MYMIPATPAAVVNDKKVKTRRIARTEDEDTVHDSDEDETEPETTNKNKHLNTCECTTAMHISPGIYCRSRHRYFGEVTAHQLHAC